MTPPWLTNLAFRASRWLTFHKVLTGLGATIAIGGSLWTTFTASNNNFPQIVLTVWLCVLTAVGWAFAFLKSRQARLALAAPDVHNTTHKIRDAYYSVISGDTSNTVISHINESLASFASVFDILTTASCRASIKQVSCVGTAGQHDARAVQVSTFCRWPGTEEPPKRFEQDFVSDNTDYITLFCQAPGNYFYSNDLLKEVGYQNSHWTLERVKEGKYDYRSTIVWPIRKKLEGGDHETWGFLCIDSMHPNIFVIDLDFPFGAAIADALYILLKEMGNRVAREEAS